MRGGLKVLSGDDVVRIFARFGFVVIGGKKHVKLRRRGPNGGETLIVPNHHTVLKATLRDIYSQASLYISKEQLHPHFYNE
jgi:predicted RNA binding protein YcfA (HicA-like mRNA interferase family)